MFALSRLHCVRFAAVFVLASALASCGGADGTPDAGTRVVPDAAPADARGPDDAGPATDADVVDAGATDAGDSTPLIEVTAPREFRAVWVASVSNLDFPSRSGLSATAARAELAAIVERTASAGLNAIVFQVRPESDALYASTLEPWSRVLTGTQGGDPGYDPLAELLTLAHARGVEVHAWLNPYRGLVSASSAAAANHVTRTLSEHTIRYGSGVVMDPGAPAVRAHVVEVVTDLARRYDVDGIHFDDYFYPYPDADGTPFPDDATYAAYRAGGGALSLGDWRRDNVNALVREVHEALAAERPAMRFGISPFGIYRPGMPTGIRGLDAFATIYCDAKRWMDEDWVDYVAPQLYWPTTQTAQAFVPLLTWWGEQADANEHVFAGHALYRLGASSAWTRDELLAQVDAVRDLAPGGRVMGSVHFRYENLDADLLGVRTALAADRYARPALAPVIPRLASSPRPAPPSIASEGGAVVVGAPGPEARFLAVYRQVGSTYELVRVHDADVDGFTLTSGEWAASSIARGGRESLAVPLSVP
jgi:uncharacterized lipoprotein YddW (UPF0748 family)